MSARIIHPTARADQLDAAAAHARRVLTTAAKRGSAALDPNPPVRWLAKHAAEIRTAIEKRTVRACPHIGDTPQLLFAAAWRPGHLVCLSCLPALDPDPAEAVRCDHCRQAAPYLHGSVTALGPVLFAYALCPRCVTGQPASAVGSAPLPGSGSATPAATP
jgi:hypothetical protein